MRRASWAALLGVLGWAAVASAHPGILVSDIPVGQPANISLSVISEEEGHGAMVGVDVVAPDTFTILGVVSAPGWKSAQDGNTVRLTGGSIPVGGTAALTLRGTAKERGQIILTVVTHATDGFVRTWAGEIFNDYPGVIVDAGLTEDTAPKAHNTKAIVLGAAGFLVLVFGAALALRARRPGASDDLPE